MPDITSRLLDQHGAPIPPDVIAQLREEISPTSAAFNRPPFSGHLAFGMDPFQLGAILRAADGGSTLDWMILAEEIEELFPHYNAVLAKRKRQFCQLPITVKAAGDDTEAQKHAELVENWIDDGVLEDALFDIADAIGKGYSVSEIVWDMKPGAITPAEFIYRPQRFFEVSWQDGDTILLRTEMGYAPLVPHKFLLHRHRSKSGMLIRCGVTRVVAFLWMYASYTQRDWALFCQAYGLPIRVGRYGPEASQTDKAVLWRAVSSIAGDVAAIIPKSMELEFVKDNERAAGSTLYEKRGDWLNREVSKVVLGSTAGTEAIHGGHAVGQEHRAAEEDVERFDARLISTTLTRQVVQLMVAFTFGPQQKYPVISIGRPDEVPLEDVIAGVANLGGLGLRVKSSELLDRLGLTKPDPGDDVIGGAIAAPAGGITPPVPDVPKLPVRPSVPPETMARGAWLGGLLTLQSEAPPELVEAMTQRLAEDAGGALAGMTDAVRAQFEAAEAMARGMALAQIVGQAGVVAELARGR